MNYFIYYCSTVFLQKDRKCRSWLHTVRTPASYCLDVHPLSISAKLKEKLMLWETKDRLMTLSQKPGVAWSETHGALMSDPDKSDCCPNSPVAAVLRTSTLKSHPESSRKLFLFIIKVPQRESWHTMVQLIIVLRIRILVVELCCPSIAFLGRNTYNGH